MSVWDSLDTESRALLCQLLDKRNNDVCQTPTDARGLINALIGEEAQRQGIVPREDKRGRRKRQDVEAMHLYYMAEPLRTMGDVGRQWGIGRNSVRSLFVKRALPLKAEQQRRQGVVPRLCECGSGRAVMAKNQCNLCYQRARNPRKAQRSE